MHCQIHGLVQNLVACEEVTSCNRPARHSQTRCLHHRITYEALKKRTQGTKLARAGPSHSIVLLHSPFQWTNVSTGDMK